MRRQFIARRGIETALRMTPAMAAVVTDRLWSVDELLNLVLNEEEAA